VKCAALGLRYWEDKVEVKPGGALYGNIMSLTDCGLSTELELAPIGE
jgi:hypothetical protein